jgi:hypothetical protein
MQRCRSDARRILTSILVATLTACGGAPSEPAPSAPGATPPAPTPPATTPPAPVAPAANPAGSGTAPADGPPGTNGFSDVTGDSALQVGAGSGVEFIDHPALGEPSVKGLILVNASGVRQTPTAPPADTVVSLNGVPLVRAVVNGATSERFFTVDPAGPQPAIAPATSTSPPRPPRSRLRGRSTSRARSTWR